MPHLKFSINVTLDGCYDHEAVVPDEELHRRAQALISGADALLFGRVTYEMMESAWREPVRTGVLPDWMEPYAMPFARAMDAAKKYVVSSTLQQVDWNAELVRGDLASAVQKLKQETGGELFVGGVQLAMSLTELRLIDKYVITVHPRIAGYGPKLFTGLTKPVDLKLTDKHQLGSGAMELHYDLVR